MIGGKGRQSRGCRGFRSRGVKGGGGSRGKSKRKTAGHGGIVGRWECQNMRGK